MYGSNVRLALRFNENAGVSRQAQVTVQHDEIIQQAIDSLKITVAKIDATPYLTTAVSILLVSVDTSQTQISNSFITQLNNWVTP